MDYTSSGHFIWLAVAFVFLGAAFVWAGVKKQQMKHEMTLKLLDKGKDLDPELIAKLLAVDKPAVVVPAKSDAQANREGGGVVGLMFLMAGLFIALSGMVGDDGTSWPRIGLGAFSFVFGYWCWVGTMKEYERAKAEEKLSRD